MALKGREGIGLGASFEGKARERTLLASPV